MLLHDMLNLLVEDITIYVDVEGQREVLSAVPGMLHHGAARACVASAYVCPAFARLQCCTVQARI